MYFLIQDIEFEKLDDDGNPIVLSDDEFQKIGNYITRTVWESDDVVALVGKIENSLNCKVKDLTLRGSEDMSI
ncbi:MAG: hypothetical protein ACO3SE_10140 [Sedimenticolaceae bacterium]|jgi:hypothetical protein